MHAGALALFSLVIAGGAGAMAQPLVAVGFVLVLASLVVARTRPATPPSPERRLSAVPGSGQVVRERREYELRLAA